jgi:hypothetical protein
MKFLIYIVGLRRSSGMKSGKFIWSDKHQKFIFEGRELTLDEFNTLMAGQWPMQKLAHQQVSGFAFVDEPAAEIPVEETAPAIGETSADSEPEQAEIEQENTEEQPAGDEDTADESPSDEAPASDDEESTIPRNPRKPRKPKN